MLPSTRPATEVFSPFPCLRQFGPRQWDPKNQRPSASLLHSYANSRRSFFFIIIKKDFSISDCDESSQTLSGGVILD